MRQNRRSHALEGSRDPRKQPSNLKKDFFDSLVRVTNMKAIIHSLVLSLLVPLLVGCAYVNDSRIYSMRPSVPQNQAQQIAKVVGERLFQRGLVLKKRVHDTYPGEPAVSG